MVRNNIKELRVEANLSRPELADKVGVGWEAIKAYEAKGVCPSLDKAFKIAIALNKDINEVFQYVEEQETENESA